MSTITVGICTAYTGGYHRASGDPEGRPGAASSQPSAVTAHSGHDSGTKDGTSKPPAGVLKFWERHSSWNMEEEQDFSRREGTKGRNTDGQGKQSRSLSQVGPCGGPGMEV